MAGENYLAFELDLDGERRHGAYFDHRYLLLEDGTPAFWADSITWFLSLLPTDAQVVSMTEAAPQPTPMPSWPQPDHHGLGVTRFACSSRWHG